MVTLLLLAGLVTLLFYLVVKAISATKYWQEKGIKTLKPLPFIGNMAPVFMNKKNVRELHMDLYKTYPEEPLTGFYDFHMPKLMVQDADYAEKVLVKDFAHFTDHGVSMADERNLPTDQFHLFSLFSLNGAKWRAYRHKMSPLFTSGKIKSMYGTFDVVGERLLNYFEKNPKNEVVMKDVMHLYAMDFVGLAVMGLNAKVLENPNSEYHKVGINGFDFNSIQAAISVAFPWLYGKLGFSSGRKQTIKYFCKVIQETVNYRKQNNIQRNDFVQMMMDLKENGKIEIQKRVPNDDNSEEDTYLETESFDITDESLMAQAYTFMTAGLDSVSFAMMFLFYDLSVHQDVQEKAREEVLQQKKMHSGLTYDALKDMTYLDNVIKESLRLHPLTQGLTRVCTKDYTFPNGFECKKGQALVVPALPMHLNPNYHSDPLEFKPERFEHAMKPGTYFPFGDGPRACIAMRLALLQVKYGAALMLANYKLDLNPKTKSTYKLRPRSVDYEPTQPFYFDIEAL